MFEIWMIMIGDIFGVTGGIIMGVTSYLFAGMNWYSHPTMGMIIFSLPCITMIILMHHLLFNVSSSFDNKLSQLQLEA